MCGFQLYSKPECPNQHLIQIMKMYLFWFICKKFLEIILLLYFRIYNSDTKIWRQICFKIHAWNKTQTHKLLKLLRKESFPLPFPSLLWGSVAGQHHHDLHSLQRENKWELIGERHSISAELGTCFNSLKYYPGFDWGILVDLDLLWESEDWAK